MFASDDNLHPQHLHWSHGGYYSAFDSARFGHFHMLSISCLCSWRCPWLVSVRRGFEVYRNVCATCHSLVCCFSLRSLRLSFTHSLQNLIAYRNLVDVSHTEVQAKALAQSVQVKDGPNDKGSDIEDMRVVWGLYASHIVGEMFERPGKLSDALPAPYPNDEYARAVNSE